MVHDDEDGRIEGPSDVAQLALLYRDLIEHSPTALIMHDGKRVVFANPAAARLLGATAIDELIGRLVTDFIDPVDIPAMVKRLGALRDTGDTSERAGVRAVRLDGGIVDTEVVGVLTVWQGRPAYQVVIYDMSAQRRAEAAQRRAEMYFTAVVEQLEEGVCVIDRNGRIESVNPAATRIFGNEGQDLVGVSILTLPMQFLDMNGQPLPLSRYPVFHTIATGEPISDYIFGVDRTDGQRRWISVSARRLIADDPDSPAVCSFNDITDQRASRKQLEFQATHDPLTGLANRSLVLARLAAALGTSGEKPVAAVLFIDLDGFKKINDTLGHAVGDTVLQIAAQRLQRGLREEDTLGRIGGDEFLVLLSGQVRAEDLESLVGRLRRTMAEPIIARGHRIRVDATIGITELGVAETRSPEAVLHDADLAMYRAKPAARRESDSLSRRPNTTHAS
ncbi:diguanylate cyclase domain-containing protein [Nocardia sp. alder85J]|uniref:diguanylate cyclase domain-containing protein n=1 Tax=Nocardia sp. alder85J TaxID=2862949 RepID=UPI001CD65F7D|nr:diguanylate cyclase [Nocardia sp. alder85J]MCX4095025.1 diguanylate cyclase [Nocardia sp. alder85J]